MAFLIILQLGLGTVAAKMAVSPDKLHLLVWHKSIGITILMLLLLRLVWRFYNLVPLDPVTSAPWERRASKLSHGALYLLMLMTPVSGWIMNSAKNFPLKLFWIVPWPNIVKPDKQLGELANDVHKTLVILLSVLVVLHVLAALRHHFSKHDGLLLRMLSGNREG